MNILLSNPKPPGHSLMLDAVVCRCAGIERKAGERLPPTGLAYIASVLRQAGHSVSILDCSVLGISPEGMASHLSGVSLFVSVCSERSLSSDLAYLQAARSAGAMTLLCGSYPTVASSLLLGLPEVDFIARGEPEHTVLELAEALASGRPLWRVRGLSFKAGGRVRHNKARPLIPCLDSLPHPARDLLDNSLYTSTYSKHSPQTMAITSRGCTFSCVFCSSCVYYGTTFRARSPANVVDELEEVSEAFGIRDFSFQDDTFTLDRRRVSAICGELKSRGLDVSWQCTSRVDTVDKGLLEEMSGAGCYLIKYGIESGDDSVLEKLKKSSTVAKAAAAVNSAKSAGLKVGGSFIIGSPWDTPQSCEKTIQFSRSLPLDYASFNQFTRFDNGRMPPGLKPYLSDKESSRYLRRAYLSFYLRPSRLFRSLLHPLKSLSAGVNVFSYVFSKAV